MTAPERMDAETRNLALMGWRPESPYNPADFRHFAAWVDEKLRPYALYLMEPVGETWMDVRERTRLVCGIRFWLAGVASMADHYLCEARKRATALPEAGLGEVSRPEKMKARMDAAVAEEKHLASLLGRYVEALDRDVSALQSLLRQHENEIRLAGVTE